MRKFISQAFATIASTTAVAQVAEDWNPQVYNAIKWTAENQGNTTIEYTSSQGITRVPMAYHGGVDWDESGEITEKNKKRFTQWVHNYLPSDYCGPIVIDYERPWWKAINAPSIMPERLQEILSVYREGIIFAQSTLPNAQWGYWGLPTLRNTSDNWLNQGLSLEQLTSQSSALYPAIYDSNPGSTQAKSTKEHITHALKLANGAIPVYAFAFPRFTGQGGDHSLFIPPKEFLEQVNAAMRAVWVDQNGIQHRIKGIILWDSYKYTVVAQWDALDKKHKYYFELLQALTKAWRNSMAGKQVETGLTGLPVCQFALPEPQNSGDVIADQRGTSEELQTKIPEAPQLENDRVSSGRIRENRISE